MTNKNRIGMTLVSYDGSIEQLLEDAVLAESLGYDDVWFGDVGAPDALTLAAVVAERTENIRIGTAVTPVYTRTPTVLAATASTLQQLSNGRFALGLGASSERMVEQWHGLDFDRPLRRVEETTELLNQIFTGAKTNYSGKTITSKGYRQAAVESPIPLFLAALRPKMLKLAASKADGVIFNFFPQSALPTIMDIIHEGALESGRDLADLEVACRFQVVVTDKVDEHIDLLRYFLAPYFAQSVYNRFLAWCGYEDIAKTIAEGWAEKDKEKTMAALTDELLHDIAIIGDKDYCQRRMREYAKQGIQTVVLSCPSIDAGTRKQTYEAFSRSEFSFDEEGSLMEQALDASVA